MGFSRPPSAPHDQFPQPTRPRFAADPEPDDDELVTNRHVHHSIHHHSHVTVDLSKTRAENRVESSSSSSSSSSSASSSVENRVVDRTPSMGTTPKGEREAVDELLQILVECMDELSTRNRETMLMKFFCEVEKDERLEKFIVERLKQSKVKILTDLYERIPPEIKAAAVKGDEMLPVTRSVVESAEELTEKLERFKIRTLDFEEDEEVKKEEDKGKSQDKSTK